MIKKLVLLLFIILINSNIFTSGSKIIAVYKPPASRKVIRELKLLGVNSVFLPPNLASVKLYKRAGFRVFVSFPVFFDSKMLLSHPELNAVDRNGIRLPKISWYRGICPTIDWFRSLQLRKLSYIVKSFPLDGIFLDFIRYPVKWESKQPILIDSSFDNTSIRKFEKYLGVRIPSSLNTTIKKYRWIEANYSKKWMEFKCHIITSFVRDVKFLINRHNSFLKLGVFVIPWKDVDYFDAVRKIAGQDVKSLSLYADYISPMLYHKSLGNNTNWIGESIIYFRRKSGKSVLPIIQAFGVKKNEFLDAIRACDTVASPTGLIIFSYSHLNRSEKLIIKRYF